MTNNFELELEEIIRSQESKFAAQTEAAKRDIELRESHAKFEAAFKTSPDAINISTWDGKFVSVNEGFTQILGYLLQEVIGKSALELNMWKNPSDRFKLIKTLRKGEVVKNLECEFVGKDAKITYGLLSASAINLNGNKLVIGITRDITQRKLLEEEIKKEYLRLKNLSEQLPGALYQIDVSSDGQVTLPFVSSNFTELIGVNIEQLMQDSKAVFHTIIQKDLPLVQASIEKSKKSLTVCNLEFEINHPKHGIRYLSANARPEKLENNTIRWHGYVIDATIQRENDQKLAEKTTHMKTIMDSSPDLIWLKNVNGQYIAVNKQFEKLVGESSDKIIGRRASDFFDVRTSTFFEERDSNAKVNGRDITDENLKFADEHMATYEIRKTAIKDSHGNLNGIIGIGRDVTEQRKLEKLLEQSNRLDAVGRFAAGVAHDINNLMQIMGLALETLTYEIEIPTQAKKYYDTVISTIQTAKARVSQLQRFAGNNEAKPILSATSLEKVLDDALASVSYLWQDKKIPLEVIKNYTNTSSVDIEAREFESILINLLKNSAEAMPNGGKIYLETSRLNDNVHLQVRDTGVGMSPETQRHLFEPFHTTKALSGRGLGLSVAYAAIKSFNGTIYLKNSTQGVGTTFELTLPIGKLKNASDVQKQNTTKLHPEAKYTILLVEDEEMILDTMQMGFSFKGHNVDTAANGAEAIVKLKEKVYDWMLTDMRMPNMNGMELAKYAHIQHPNLKIAIVTGDGESSIKQKERGDCGITTVMGKPFSIDAMLKRLQDY